MIPRLSRHGLAGIRARLERLYGGAVGRSLDRFATLVGRYGVGEPEPAQPRRWDQRDAVLIAYPDMVEAPGEKTLHTLADFVQEHLDGTFSTIHVLPFFPWSSDDGFSVIHYRQVEPAYGSWPDLQALAARRRLMADLVLNHASRRSGWFLDFENDVAPARGYFIAADPAADLSAVVRPRTSPLLTPVQTRSGVQQVWTTFSSDQMDLNFANPDVLFEMLDILLFYISMGVRVVRLDAVAYLWKTPGTACIHLPQTHEVVRLMRDLVNIVAPDVTLVTETNVPHAENVSYFGQGDEAHMVYQFSLPPLVLHAMVTGSALGLRAWAAALQPSPPGCAFLNFTASHDGIGVRPLEGLVPDSDLDLLARHTRHRGGQVSARKREDGSESPYEFNISWFDAMGGTEGFDDRRHLARYLCSQTIPLALRGIPAVYFNSLVAAPNYAEGVARTGRARTINRRKWHKHEIQALLADAGSVPARALAGIKRLLKVRAGHRAFDPDGAQEVLPLDDRLFGVRRSSPDGSETVIAISNCSGETVDATIAAGGTDLLGGQRVAADGAVRLGPYQSVWLSY
jgi:glycosidase